MSIKRTWISFLSLSFFFQLFSQGPISKIDSLDIMNVISSQEKAWNSGNIDLFMEGYIKSEELVFSGSGGPVYGWKATKDRYFKSYPDLKTMGKLTFRVNKIKSLSPNTAYLIGEYYLKRIIDDSFGHFTLLWKKINGKWLIISDHTSSSDNN